MTPDGAGEVGQGARVVVEQRRERARIVQPEAAPRVGREVQLRPRDRTPPGKEPEQLGGRQLAESIEPAHARVGADANKAERRAARASPRTPGEHAQQLQLVEQVVLEPQHDLVPVGGVVEGRVRPDQRRERLVVGRVAAVGQVTGSRLAERGFVGAARARALVQDVSGDRNLARQAGLPERARDAVAVGHVQHGRPDDRAPGV